MKVRYFLSLIILSLLCYSETKGLQSTNAQEINWYTNGNIISEISLEDLEKNNIYIIPDQILTKPISKNLDFSKIILSLLDQTNIGLIDLLSKELFQSNEFINLPKKSDLLITKIKNELYPKSFTSGMSEKELIIQDSKGNILIKKADILETVMIKVTNSSKNITESQRMIHISGDVILYAQGYTIHSKKITINGETREIFASGEIAYFDKDIIVLGDSLLLNSREVNGYMNNAVGVLEPKQELALEIASKCKNVHDLNQFFKLRNEQKGEDKEELKFFRGKLVRINSKDHFTVDNATITVCEEVPPHFSFYSRRFDYYGKEQMMLDNSIFYLHNQPLIYFPFFYTDPFSTGITASVGKTKREGLYLLTSFGMKFKSFTPFDINLNYYENLGIYFKVLNNNNIGNFKYNFNGSMAWYSENSPISFANGNNFRNSVYIKDLQKRFRYRVNFQPSLTLFKKEIEFQKLEENSRGSNDIKTQSATTKVSAKSTESALGLNGQLSGAINISSDPTYISSLEARNVSNYNTLLNEPTLIEGVYELTPTDEQNISFSYFLSAPSTSLTINGKWLYRYKENIELLETDPDRFYSYLNSQVFPNISFSHNGSFDPAVNNSGRLHLNIGYNFRMSYSLLGQYIYPSNRNEPNRLDYNENHLSVSSDLSRTFRIDKYPNGKYISFFDFSFTPYLRFLNNGLWKNKNQTDTELRNNYIQLSTSESIHINFPSAKIKNEWNNSLGKVSMLPQFNYSLTHNYFIKDDYYPDSSYSLLKVTTNHIQSASLTSSLSAVQRGYGLFLIPWLDFVQNAGINIGYKLPVKNNESTAINYWRLTNIQSFTATHSLNISYANPYKPKTSFAAANNLSATLYEKQFSELQLTPKANNLNFSYNFKSTTNSKSAFQFNNLVTSFDWSYNFPTNMYSADRMNFGISFNFTVFKTFLFSFSSSSENISAWKYFNHKTDHYNIPSINFWEDLITSTGLRGINKLQEGNFKLNSFAVSLSHDLHKWFMRIDYSVKPVAIRGRGSFVGYYFDQKLSFEINLKPKVESSLNLNQKFPKLEIESTPDSFKQL